MAIGERIKALRKSLHVTQQQFADHIGTSQNAVALYETKKRNPSSSVLNNICKTFNVSEAWLRTGEGEMLAQRSREDEISDAVHRLLSGESSDFKRRLILVLSTLSDSEWSILEDRLRQILGEQGAKPRQMTIEEEARLEAEQYYQELLAKKRAEAKLSVSEHSSESIA